MMMFDEWLNQAETRQRGQFLQRYRQLQSLRGEPVCAQQAVQLQQALQTSIARVQGLRATFPAFNFPHELPVCQRREEIGRLIAAHPVVVIAGETGSGKTTQLPKICLDMGLGARGLIGHTQPRRLAARSVAARLTDELGSAGAACVGYKVRFTDRTQASTRIKLMTDGILLNELQSDRYLSEYEVLIIDEAHERSLNIDFVLGYLKHLLPRRPDLKVIITSATINPQRFSTHFSNAPVLEVSGRVYPVEVRYRPFTDETENQDLGSAVIDAAKTLMAEGPGDILVFLSGEREIMETAEQLVACFGPHVAVLPLYARLSLDEQNRVFQSQAQRRIILATNVAETSLTVPGIRYVIDSGKARISRYSHRSKIQHLPIEPISQASANQRKGRCGRLQAGVCIRLYSEEDFLQRTEFTEAEILRTNLASIILQMLSMRLGDIEQFPFVDPPDYRYIKDGLNMLHELQALDDQQQLTDTGGKLARLPVDPRFGRMLIAAAEFNCLQEILVIVSFLSIQDPRERPPDRQQQADEKHRRFTDKQSDFFAILNLWNHLEAQRTVLSRNQFRRQCQQDFLAWMRVHEWCEVQQQLQEICHGLGMTPSTRPAHRDFIHRALLTGLLSHIGFKTEEGDYLGARNTRFHIFPGSGLFQQKPIWLMAAERVETSRLYARTTASIQPEWLETIAQHLIKRSYREPHWEKKRGCIVALEQQSLYGLIIVAGRKVDYSSHDPALCRELFIRHALVDGELIATATFLKHNQALKDSIFEEEHRQRRAILQWDTTKLHAWFAQRIPDAICNTKTLINWYRPEAQKNPALLCLQRADLMQETPDDIENQFPRTLRIAELTLNLDYRFEPGHAEDGVSVRIPLAVIGQLQQSQFEFLIPGLLREKITALIKSLPKPVRRNFIPAPDFAKACHEKIQPGKGPLTEQLTCALLAMTGVRIDASDWDQTRLPEHLRFKFTLIDDQNQSLQQSSQLSELQQTKADLIQTTQADTNLQTFHTDWDFDELPAEVWIQTSAGRSKTFPALQDCGEHVLQILADTREKADALTRQGIIRLLLIRCRQHAKYLAKQFPELATLALTFQRTGNPQDLLNDIMTAIINHHLGADPLPPLSRDRFEHWHEQLRYALVPETTALIERLTPLGQQLKSIKTDWFKRDTDPFSESRADIHHQLEQLFCPGFISRHGIDRLHRYAHYLRGLQLRMERLDFQLQKDLNAIQQLTPWIQRQNRFAQAWRTRYGQEQYLPAAWWRFRWLLEEYRLSLFAQTIKTAEPVSEKRLQQYWQEQLQPLENS